MLGLSFLLLAFLGHISDGVCCKRKPNFGCCGNGGCNIFCCNCDGGCNTACERTNCNTGDWFKCAACASGCAAACVVTDGAACASCLIQCGGLVCCKCYAGAVCPQRRRLATNGNFTFDNYWDTCGVDGNAESIFEFDGQIQFPMNQNYFIAAALGVGFVDDIDCILGMFDDLDVDNSSFIEEIESSGTHRECENYRTTTSSNTSDSNTLHYSICGILFLFINFLFIN